MTQDPAARLFCFGLGFSAEALCRRLKARGWRVAGTTRSVDRVRELSAQGFEMFQFDAGLGAGDIERALEGATHIVVSVPPDGRDDAVLRLCSNALARLDLKWIGYLSTTGVYGDHAGGMVDETTPTHPTNERSKRRVAAEQAWFAWGAAHRVPVHVFRLAGIYGPGRNQLVSLREGRARRIVKQGQVFSRIHVEDIATVLEASIAKPRAGAIYNVCDDEPAPSDEVVAFAADLLNVPAPPIERFEDVASSMTEMARSFYADSRRVDNSLIKRELGVVLKYPTFREGLSALLPL